MTSKGISPGARLGARSKNLGMGDRRHQRDTQARLRPTDFVGPLQLRSDGRVALSKLSPVSDATDADDAVLKFNALLADMRLKGWLEQ